MVQKHSMGCRHGMVLFLLPPSNLVIIFMIVRTKSRLMGNNIPPFQHDS